MGIFDEIKRAVDIATKPTARPNASRGERSSAPPPPPRPGVAALEAAQKRRRERGTTKANGKKATPRDLSHYEHLERALVLQAGRFPLDAATTRQTLLARGFEPAHVEAYLSSDAARKLLE